MIHEKALELKADLESLSFEEYELSRSELADKHGVRKSALDRMWKRAHHSENGQAHAEEIQGKAVAFQEPEPWPDPVDGLAMLDELTDTIKHYIVLSEGSAEAIALWIIHSHAHHTAQISPILCINSPEKRCGKTTLLDLLSFLVARPLPSANVTPAALFRVTEKFRPTLLIDEGDTFLKKNEELRGILNSGHLKPQAFVVRAVSDGKDFKVRIFSTWAPKAISLIGRLSSTLADRSIIVSMKRKTAAEKVERLRLDRAGKFAELKRKIIRWVQDNEEALSKTDPVIPLTNDRACDNWRALVGIAEVVGAEWPEKARQAALKLTVDEEDDARIQLLEDINEMFLEDDKIASNDMAARLCEMEHRPWPEWRNGKAITPRQIAQLLKPFGIEPKRISDGSRTVRGYRVEMFTDAFTRYIRHSVTNDDKALQDSKIEHDGYVTHDGYVCHDDDADMTDTSDMCQVAVIREDNDNSLQYKQIGDSAAKHDGMTDNIEDRNEVISKNLPEFRDDILSLDHRKDREFEDEIPF